MEKRNNSNPAANATCDPGPMQDFCVGINRTYKGAFVNGEFCKNPKEVTVQDFIFTRLNMRRNINTSFGIAANERLITDFQGLNSNGISITRIDLTNPGDVNPIHSHPRSSEIIHVVEGKMLSGFVTGRGNNYTLFAKILKPGQGMVIPLALPHFQMNVGKSPFVAFIFYNSQNPGLLLIPNSVFQTYPPINTSILARTYKIPVKLAMRIQRSFQAEPYKG
ncbi:hypothetical protein ACFE04_018973 [Oxalis oulophora]